MPRPESLPQFDNSKEEAQAFGKQVEHMAASKKALNIEPVKDSADQTLDLDIERIIREPEVQRYLEEARELSLNAREGLSTIEWAIFNGLGSVPRELAPDEDKFLNALNRKRQEFVPVESSDSFDLEIPDFVDEPSGSELREYQELKMLFETGNTVRGGGAPADRQKAWRRYHKLKKKIDAFEDYRAKLKASARRERERAEAGREGMERNAEFPGEGNLPVVLDVTELYQSIPEDAWKEAPKKNAEGRYEIFGMMKELNPLLIKTAIAHADVRGFDTRFVTSRARVPMPEKWRLGGREYSVGKLLGAGGMGEVHEVRAEAVLDKDGKVIQEAETLAMKISYMQSTGFPEGIKETRLLQEVAIHSVLASAEDQNGNVRSRIARSIKHARTRRAQLGLQHYPEFIDAVRVRTENADGEEVDALVTFMEKVEGKTLAEEHEQRRVDWENDEGTETVRLDRLNQLSGDLQTMIEATEGVIGVHANGIIHRDIKPSNMMRDQNGRVKVLDFGIGYSDELRALFQEAGLQGRIKQEDYESMLKQAEAIYDLLERGGMGWNWSPDEEAVQRVKGQLAVKDELALWEGMNALNQFLYTPGELNDKLAEFESVKNQIASLHKSHTPRQSLRKRVGNFWRDQVKPLLSREWKPETDDVPAQENGHVPAAVMNETVDPGITKHRQVVGTPVYMPPESIKGEFHESFDPEKSDSYTLAQMFAEQVGVSVRRGGSMGHLLHLRKLARSRKQDGRVLNGDVYTISDVPELYDRAHKIDEALNKTAQDLRSYETDTTSILSSKETAQSYLASLEVLRKVCELAQIPFSDSLKRHREVVNGWLGAKDKEGYLAKEGADPKWYQHKDMYASMRLMYTHASRQPEQFRGLAHKLRQQAEAIGYDNEPFLKELENLLVEAMEYSMDKRTGPNELYHRLMELKMKVDAARQNEQGKEAVSDAQTRAETLADAS